MSVLPERTDTYVVEFVRCRYNCVLFGADTGSFFI
nr:MAG TPA: hypothetical protein [Caudoviricetes sp.]